MHKQGVRPRGDVAVRADGTVLLVWPRRLSTDPRPDRLSYRAALRAPGQAPSAPVELGTGTGPIAAAFDPATGRAAAAWIDGETAIMRTSTAAP